MNILSTDIRVMPLIVAAVFSIVPARSQPAQADDDKAAIAHFFGSWICNNVSTDIYGIKDDQTATHFADQGVWRVTDQTLTISWKNGYRLTIDTTQRGDAFSAYSYAPNKTQPNLLQFAKSAVTMVATTFPMKRTLTSEDGRKMPVTLISRDDTSVKIRRDSDNKELDLPLDKLSAEDRKFIIAIKQPEPIPFDGAGIRYGNYILLKCKGMVYAIQITGINDDKSPDPCIYSIEYTAFKISDKFVATEINKRKVGGEKDGMPIVKFGPHEISWSARGAETGHIYLQSIHKGNHTIYADDQKPLPDDAQYYNKQFPSLNYAEKLDPAGWLPVSK